MFTTKLKGRHAAILLSTCSCSLSSSSCSLPQQNGPLVTLNGQLLTHHNHTEAIVYSKAVCGAGSMHLGKYITACLYHYSILWNRVKVDSLDLSHNIVMLVMWALKLTKQNHCLEKLFFTVSISISWVEILTFCKNLTAERIEDHLYFDLQLPVNPHCEMFCELPPISLSLLSLSSFWIVYIECIYCVYIH